MALNVPLLRQNFSLVVDREPQVVHQFYGILFERYPQLKPMFHRVPPETQEQMLGSMLVSVMDRLEDASWFSATLEALGARHRDYGITEEMYGWVGECFLATLSKVSGSDWNADVEAAWIAVYGEITKAMLRGAAQA